MATSPPKELLKFLKPYDRAVRELALSVRELVLAELAPCYENIYDAYSAVAIGYGPTDRLKDGICHVAVYSKYVNLGFNRGTELDDPLRLLNGTGKRIRHIAITTPADLSHPEIRELLRRAREHAGLGAPVQSQKKKVISVVKAVYPKKRRPN